MSFQKDHLKTLIQKGKVVCEHVLDYLAKESNVNGKLSVSKLDRHQTLAYDASWMESELYAADQMVEYAARVGGELEEKLAEFFVADALQDVCQRIIPVIRRVELTNEKLHATVWGEDIAAFISEKTSPAFYEPVAALIQAKHHGGNYGLTEEQSIIRDTFKKFAEEHVVPIAEKVHRHDLLIPQNIIDGLKEMGCFGLSIPQQYGGFQDDSHPDNMGMIIVTEELSRGSLGVAGSLITRPEILSKAVLKGGTEEQKQRWLPSIAMGEKMCAVAVTEPDFGSDVAGMKVTAVRKGDAWVLNGCKTWCTFAGYAHLLLVLARTNPDPAAGHKGLSILVAEKPSFDGHSFEHTQSGGGHISGRAIGTIGYRGMHSYEVHFENYEVPAENLVGGEAGLGKGFYLQMEGFAGGRLQTAARASGVMQAAFEKGLQYSLERSVFGQPIINYQITKFKLVKMAAILQACRQLTYHSARLMDRHEGVLEASLVKFYSCKVAEWVTREAMQLHGGMGYAEEYAVSRYFVDARVFSIFEGAEDVLALRVIARSLVEGRLSPQKNA